MRTFGLSITTSPHLLPPPPPPPASSSSSGNATLRCCDDPLMFDLELDGERHDDQTHLTADDDAPHLQAVQQEDAEESDGEASLAADAVSASPPGWAPSLLARAVTASPAWSRESRPAPSFAATHPLRLHRSSLPLLQCEEATSQPKAIPSWNSSRLRSSIVNTPPLIHRLRSLSSIGKPPQPQPADALSPAASTSSSSSASLRSSLRSNSISSTSSSTSDDSSDAQLVVHSPISIERLALHRPLSPTSPQSLRSPYSPRSPSSPRSITANPSAPIHVTPTLRGSSRKTPSLKHLSFSPPSTACADEKRGSFSATQPVSSGSGAGEGAVYGIFDLEL